MKEGCDLCPRACGVNRRLAVGRCGETREIRVARAALHHWEEPCLSGSRGSGTVFFSGCGLGCVFCQNHAISRGGVGQVVAESALPELFLGLQAQGAHNLNLVTGTHFWPGIVRALERAKEGGLRLPVVWNTGGYETAEAIEALARHVDIWLMDVKFYDSGLSAALAGAPDYFAVAGQAARLACRLAGPPLYADDGLLQKGFLLRLLVLPGQRQDAQNILYWAAQALPKGGFLLSLMSQYTPPGPPMPLKALERRVSSFEYRQVEAWAVQLGLENGYSQNRSAASAAYIPPFLHSEGGEE